MLIDVFLATLLAAADGGDDYLAVVAAPRQIAVEEPVAAVPQLASHLAFEPRVDLQARGSAETQGDVAVRGGTFENTGVTLGASALFDPQTGHYLTELPVPPAMLSPPQVLAGWDNAMVGFNSNVATLAYRWKPIDESLRATASVSDGWTNHQDLYLGHGWQTGDMVVATDLNVARGAGDGTLRDSHFEFARAAARFQIRTPETQTDLFGGYQSKQYGWPYLYAVREVHDAVGSLGAESDDMETLLVAINQQFAGERATFELTGVFRNQVSDYEFDSSQPDLFNPFEHETWVWSGGARWRYELGDWAAVLASGQLVHDRIESSSLLYGTFGSRTYAKLGLGAELDWSLSDAWSLAARVGATYDDSDRDAAHGSPALEVSLQGEGQRYYLQASRATQVPGYTALAANPDAGLFRGNSSLGRERSDNYEAGGELEVGRMRFSAALFHRRDHDLVDWTFAYSSPAARTANPVDIATTGIEASARGRVSFLRWLVAYTWLSKTEDYGSAQVDASFYALNYPTHRLTASLVAEPLPGFEIRSDNELRQQEANALRSGRHQVVLSSLRVLIRPPGWKGIELNVSADNLFNLGFQEVPGVPGSRRRIGAGLAFQY
jgi:hypothetical protein